MKLSKNEKTGANTVELEIAIEAEQVREATSKVYRRDAKKYNVPGFRKGRAPRNLIEKMYGADVFVFDAVNELFPEAYEAALKEAELDAVGRPDAELLSASAENGAVLKVVVTTRPVLNVGTYKGLAATRTVTKADETKVDEEIDRLRQRNARMITREGAAQDGDIVNIDYEGSVDGVPFDGGKDAGHSLTLGSGQFIPGFEEQLVGHAVGEELDVNVTFPAEYHANELAGKAAVFKVKINEVQQRELDELDDDFAMEVSEYDTLEALKQSIRDENQKQLDEQADLEVENQLVSQIVETIEGEIPEVMYESRMDEMVRDFAFRLENQGLNLETYLKYTGMDEKAFRDGFREQAEKQVKMRLALETVVRLEGIAASDEDIGKEVARIAEKYQMEEEKVRSLMPVAEIAKDLAVNKAIDLIKETAVVTDKAPKDGDAKPEKAKKASGKKAKKAGDGENNDAGEA